jgi:hypothetical protein
VTALRPPVAAAAATPVTLDEGSPSGLSLEELNFSDLSKRSDARRFL